MTHSMRNALANPTALVYVLLALLLVAAQCVSPGFLSVRNMNNILVQSAFLGIVAIGQTLVILVGGIDLSIASVITLTNLIAAAMMNGSDANIPAAFAVSALIGLLAGVANGACIHYLRVPPIIMTLATGSVLQGIGLIYSSGAPKGYTAPLIKTLSTGRMVGVFPYIAIIWLVLAACAIFVLRRTVFGRSVYALGTNITAARYSGIGVAKCRMAIYGISGTLAGVVGALYVGYTNTSFLSAGQTFMMSSVAAVVVGGTSSAGGRGGYVGTIAGAIIMTVITAILTIANVHESGRKVMEGALILLLVYLYSRKQD